MAIGLWSHMLKSQLQSHGEVGNARENRLVMEQNKKKKKEINPSCLRTAAYPLRFKKVTLISNI